MPDFFRILLEQLAMDRSTRRVSLCLRDSVVKKLN
jgi:hypothetical protein